MAKRLYISFAEEDSEFATAFAKHLSPLRRSGKIEIVDDGSLGAGELRLASKIEAVHRADVVALLVSVDFMANDEIWNDVLPTAMERQARDRMPIIPILVRPQDLTGSLLQGKVTLPRKGGPVNRPRNDAAWTTIVEELRQILDRLPERSDVASPDLTTQPRPIADFSGAKSARDPKQPALPELNMGIDLKGEQIKSFTSALMSAFPTPDKLQRMVRFGLNVKLQEIVVHGPLADMTFMLVAWAEEQGRLDDLLRAALAENPTNPLLRNFTQEVAASSDTAPEQKLGEQLEKIFLKGVLFQDVEEWRAKMAFAERCVCRVEIKERGFWKGIGTGFLIAPNRILTNSHVARDFASAGTTRVQFEYKVGPAGSEDAGRMCALAATWNRAESPVTALDYTIVELAERPGDDQITSTGQRGWLVPKKHHFVVNEPCFILQHPDAQRMKVCAGAISAVALTERKVFYTTNTLPGSSGSPCFTIDWDLVALHHASDAPGNRGIPMTDILADLGNQKALHLLGAG